MLLIMHPSAKRGYIVVLMPVGPFVCPSVDHMVFADYLNNYLSQNLNSLHIDWL
jgi:hypothetical protein